MTGSPVVSVITIFLNEERFLEEAVESVLAQTHPRWELLLVDDGSTDGSTSIAQRYAAQCPTRIRYLCHPQHLNRGMSASRNLGLKHATGEYIAFLDADDVYLPEKLERELAVLEARPEVGMVYGPTLYWYEWDGAERTDQKDWIDFADGRGTPPGSVLHPPSLLTSFLEHPGRVPCMCSLLVRREAVLDAGGFQDRFRSLFEDQVFYSMVGLRWPVLVLDSCLARYRQHPRSSCATAERNGTAARARHEFLCWLEERLREEGVEDPAVWHALGQQLRPYRAPFRHRATQLLEKRSMLPAILQRMKRKMSRREGAPYPAGDVGYWRGKLQWLVSWLRREDRSHGLREEVEFWRSWLATKGLQWPEDYAPRLDPEQPIQEHVATYIDQLPGKRIHILDVGAGPLTKLGKVHPAKEIVITATDILADEYDRLLAEFGIEPPVRTILADAERLVEQFGEKAFDIVHGQNCVDHMTDPLRAIEQMLKVVKPHGFVVLFHVENEGKKQEYRELHQWDFTCEDGTFVIRGRRGVVLNVSERLAAVAEIDCVLEEGNVLTAIRKRSD